MSGGGSRPGPFNVEIKMANAEREAMWKECVAQWRSSGLSQRAFAENQGYAQRQLNYWVRRLDAPVVQPALLPVSIAAPVDAAPALSLRRPNGWIVTLPAALPTNWVAALLRELA
jgi:hypothetical protein